MGLLVWQAYSSHYARMARPGVDDVNDYIVRTHSYTGIHDLQEDVHS